MNITIAGDGEVGVHLAKSLSELDYNITVVDPHSELLKRLESETDLLTITGDATTPAWPNATFFWPCCTTRASTW